jgi:hypothetical protein
MRTLHIPDHELNYLRTSHITSTLCGLEWLFSLNPLNRAPANTHRTLTSLRNIFDSCGTEQRDAVAWPLSPPAMTRARLSRAA